ncbi:MAG: hypothetical protein AB8G11_21925 [Saprospiraceae bacterium]
MTNKQVANIVLSSFEKALKDDNDKLKNNNSLRSSYFVSLIGDELKKDFKGKDLKVNYQKVNKLTKEKESGEWLFDICVTTQLKLNHRESSKINTSILLACESEFSTDLSDFTKDFGKLICSNAKQLLFIQGLNQESSKGRENFIQKRQNLIISELSDYIKNDFVLAFIPTPGKVGNLRSFWNLGESILSYTSIWIYNAAIKKFIKQ